MSTIDKSALRDAASVIALRDRESDPHVLMGQRGATAAFMPSKFVFPGGAVDAADTEVPLARPLPALCAERLTEDAPGNLANALAAAAIRELWEETGLLPSAEALQFVFRAITPPGRPRRFDARFFLVDAGAIQGDLDDFSAACEELSHLQWIPLARAREFDLPFITEVVLAEIAARAHDPEPPASVPFFRNDDEESLFLRLQGLSPLTARP